MIDDAFNSEFVGFKKCRDLLLEDIRKQWITKNLRNIKKRLKK